MNEPTSHSTPSRTLTLKSSSLLVPQKVKKEKNTVEETTRPAPRTRLENERMKMYRRSIIQKRPIPKKSTTTTRSKLGMEHQLQLQFNQAEKVNEEKEKETKPKQGFKLQAQKDIELFHKHLITNNPRRGEFHM